MKILNQEPEVSEKPKSNLVDTPTDFSTLLKDYGQPATIENQTQNEQKTDITGGNVQSTPSNVSTASTGWQGNPEYYQTGKKAGQKKPNRAKVTYTPSNQTASISGDLISGAMFLALINLLMPSLLVAVHNYLTKDKNLHLKWSDIKISQEQENKLAPIADMAAKQIILSWSPTAIFFVSLFSLFAMNLAVARMSKDLENKAKK